MMMKTLAAGLLATTMLAAPALAQSTTAPSTSAPAGPAVTGPNGVQFYTQTAADANWRGSKFMGVDIYGTNNEKIGDVKDLVLDHEGTIQAVVIGVGGFLGIGEKNVAVPFKSVDWTTQPVRSSTAMNGTANTTAAPGAASSGTAMNGTAANGTVANGSAMNNGATDVTGTTANAANRAYPDHGMIRLTKDELKAAPTYRYPDESK